MTATPFRALTRLAAGLALTIPLGLAGCGGSSGGVGDAVVRPEAGADVSSTTPVAAKTTTAVASTPEKADTSKPADTAAPSVKAEGWGTLKGQVVFGGSPPAIADKVAKGQASKDPTWCAKDGPIKSERLMVDAGTKGVKFAIVYIPKPTAINPEAKAKASTAKVLFDQANCTFEPHVLCTMLGATIELKSSDKVNHNVDAKLKAGASLNPTIAPGNKLDFAPTAAERTPALVTCAIHPWMEAYWMVIDSPYFAVTDEKGNFEIKNVPAGTQKVVVWQEATKFVTASTGENVTITPNDTVSKTFTMDPGTVKPAS